MAVPEEVLDRLYAALFAGDTDAALALCASGGQWHTLTPFRSWHGTYPLETYVREVAPVAVASLGGYRVDWARRDTLDTLVVTRTRTSWDAGDGRESGAGVHIAYVVGHQVADIYSISADPDQLF